MSNPTQVEANTDKLQEAAEEALKTAKPARSESQIEADLEATRRELTETVAELTAQLDPKFQFNNAKNAVKDVTEEKVAKVKEAAQKVTEKVKEGDVKTLAIVGGAAAATVGLVAAVVFSIWRKNR